MFSQSTIIWRFPKRKKEEEFSIYKEDEKGNIIIQSDKTIALINMDTHKGMINQRGSNNKYFVHLNEILGAEPFEFSVELIERIERKKPRKGELIGSSEIAGDIFQG